MLYDITLRDLSIVGTTIGICLRLYGCQEVHVSAKMNTPSSFAIAMVVAKATGYQIVAAGRIPTIIATEIQPEDVVASVKADIDSAELRANDPMYRVANEYATHQRMREVVRQIMMHELPNTRDIEWQEACRNMGLLTLWLALHDPVFPNAMRQDMLQCLRLDKQAILTVACSEELAYAYKIASSVADLTEALRHASNSRRSTIFRQPRLDRNR
jgi:hypothetical protein